MSYFEGFNRLVFSISSVAVKLNSNDVGCAAIVEVYKARGLAKIWPTSTAQTGRPGIKRVRSSIDYWQLGSDPTPPTIVLVDIDFQNTTQSILGVNYTRQFVKCLMTTE